MKTKLSHSKSVPPFLTAIAAGCLALTALAAEPVVLYDNFPDPILDDTWICTEGGLFGAQQFFTSGDGVVSSVKMLFNRSGNPEGVLGIELWDDQNGAPGERVAILGEVDATAVRHWEEGWDVITFKNPVIGLRPLGSYYLVFNPSNLTYDDSNKVCLQVEQEGDEPGEVNGAGVMLIWPTENGWVKPSNILDTWDYHVRMTISVSPEDVPDETPRMIFLKKSEASVDLSWQSLPYRSYAVEYRASLKEGDWIEIASGLDSEGWETGYADADSDRLGLSRGFYRVRLQN
ncbi:hypothetical protein V2O64_06805 [Verrucomicrobiaceae bacterium 227]